MPEEVLEGVASRKNRSLGIRQVLSSNQRAFVSTGEFFYGKQLGIYVSRTKVNTLLGIYPKTTVISDIYNYSCQALS